jgi:hypothetical protein
MLQLTPLNSQSSVTILRDRSTYTSCHIAIADSTERLPAIQVDNKFYSFFRFEANQEKAFDVVDKLTQRGDVALVTQTPKGFAVWVFEADATLANHTQEANPKPKATVNLPYFTVVDRSQYKPCHIYVPDLPKRLAAISFHQRYYSLFKALDDIEAAVRLSQKLYRRGDAAIITKTAKGYGVWIYEADATLATSPSDSDPLLRIKESEA